MTDLIKLTKIKKNLYNNQYGESFLIYCKEDGTYDFLYENLIYSDQLDDRSFSFENEIDVVKFLETKDINQFQKETFNNLLVSFWTTTFIRKQSGKPLPLGRGYSYIVIIRYMKSKLFLTCFFLLLLYINFN